MMEEGPHDVPMYVAEQSKLYLQCAPSISFSLPASNRTAGPQASQLVSRFLKNNEPASLPLTL